MESIYDELKEYAKSQKSSGMISDSYFYDFRSNIFGGNMPLKFQKMFLAGEGNELVAKACAVHSSSMLGYNFFHWVDDYPITIKWNDGKVIRYDMVSFEEKIPVLVGKTPANMDIVLRNSTGDILFIESKFLEYTNTGSFSLSKTYLNPSQYYTKGEEWGKLISNLNTKHSKQYWEGIAQEIRHLIGITNWIEHKTVVGGVMYNGTSDIRFINLVFEPKVDYVEHSAFSEYRKRYAELHAKLEELNLLPTQLKMEFMTYSDLWEIVRDMNNLPYSLKDYLSSHYMFYSE